MLIYAIIVHDWIRIIQVTYPIATVREAQSNLTLYLCTILAVPCLACVYNSCCALFKMEQLSLVLLGWEKGSFQEIKLVIPFRVSSNFSVILRKMVLLLTDNLSRP